MTELGICMAGLEEAVERTARLIDSRFNPKTYLEIGVAYGQTIAPVASWLTGQWRAIGIDFADGYSFDLVTVKQRAEAHGVTAEVRCPDEPAEWWNQISIYLNGSTDFLKRWKDPIHMAFIDGCHGPACVTADFLAVEPHVPVGGIVMFHDIGLDSVGEPQKHCPRGDTLGAVTMLGLFGERPDGRNQRPGWRHVETVVGDKSRVGRDLGIFERC